MLALMGLNSSCSKDEQAPTTYQGATKEVALELSTTFVDDAELRSVHAVNSDGTTGKLQMAEKDLSVRVAIRRGTGAPVQQTLTFKKVVGKNEATFKGKVTVPDTGTGNYSLAAIVLGEEGTGGRSYATLEGNLVKTLASNSPALPKSGKVATTVPYILDWTPLTLGQDRSGEWFEKKTATFKPSGSLLAIRINNSKGKAAITVSKIKIKSNAFVTAWSYDFANLTGGNLLQGNATTAATEQEFTLPQAVTVAAETLSPTFYYLAAMPVKATADLSTQFTVITSDGKSITIPASSKQLLAGTVPMSLPIPGEKVPDLIENSCFKSKRLPIEFLAHYNIDATGIAFDKTMSNTALGTYNWQDAKTNFEGGITIEGKRYRLPSLEEFKSILPIKTIHLKSGNEYLGRQEAIAADKEVYNTTADYRVETVAQGFPRKFYALRLKHETLCMQTAYRYEFVGDFVNGSTTSYLKITCRYLGNSFDWSIEDVATEAFWSKNTTKDIVRYLPASTGSTSSRKAGNTGSYWTSSAYTLSGYGMSGGFQWYTGTQAGVTQQHFEMFGEQTTSSNKLAIRLIAEEPVSPVNVPRP